LTGQHARRPAREPGRFRLSRLIPETSAQRAISLATFVNTFGTGVFITISALFFTQVVHLSTARYGLGLFIGSMLGL
jgi:hypothetical protein